MWSLTQLYYNMLFGACAWLRERDHERWYVCFQETSFGVGSAWSSHLHTSRVPFFLLPRVSASVAQRCCSWGNHRMRRTTRSRITRMGARSARRCHCAAGFVVGLPLCPSEGNEERDVMRDGMCPGDILFVVSAWFSHPHTSQGLVFLFSCLLFGTRRMQRTTRSRETKV